MKTTLLCILDGFGLNPRTDGNAVALARKPHFDSLWERSPRATLVTYGPRVGLPEGQMGNAEVGHLNIGAGRVVEQWLVRISRELREDLLPQNEAYQTFTRTIHDSKTLHVIGLLSDGGVHSHREHLELLLPRVAKDFSGQIVIHAITDGRDVQPESGAGHLAWLSDVVARLPRARIGSVCGRFYAMDRDKRWERTEKAYRLIVDGAGTPHDSPREAVLQSYEGGVTDEFVEPISLGYSGVAPGDAVLFWNYREDRMRQIVRALCVDAFDGFSRPDPAFSRDRVLCFTEYDHTFHLPFIFSPIDITNHLGEVVAKAGLAQLRVAETEKYPHVTYFLNGGIESEYAGEERKLVPSPRDVKTYDLKPEMSAQGVTDIVVEAIESGKYSLVVVNLANADMVGHTGVLAAAIKAVETVDGCLGRMISALRTKSGQAFILADHGNADQMIHYEDGSPHTAHTTHPVPAICVDVPGVERLRDGGALCDVAPTILKMMGLPQPAEMKGTALYGA